MVADIKGTGAGAPPAIDTASRQATRSTASGAATTPSTPAEVVTLTERAARLQELNDAVRDLPVVDEARVSALKEALASGGYAIDDEAVADKLAALEAALARGRRA